LSAFDTHEILAYQLTSYHIASHHLMAMEQSACLDCTITDYLPSRSEDGHSWRDSASSTIKSTQLSVLPSSLQHPWHVYHFCCIKCPYSIFSQYHCKQNIMNNNNVGGVVALSVECRTWPRDCGFESWPMCLCHQAV